MKLFGFEISRNRELPVQQAVAVAPQPSAEVISNPNMGYGGYGGGYYMMPFNGETETGEMGPIRKYLIDHVALRMRSNQLDLESDVIHALFTRSAMWGIGDGLKLQAEPKTEMLKRMKIDMDGETFNKNIEDLFQVFAESTVCDYKGLRCLCEIASEGWQDEERGGDTLLVMRVVNGMPKVDLIDGSHVCSPLGFTNFLGFDVINPNNGNRIRHGVELDSKGAHVAYWVRKGDGINALDYERIQARMSTFPYSELARLIYGQKYCIDNTRGIPIIASTMETAAKMGRYMSAALASAEERAKIVYAVENDINSTEENPGAKETAKAIGFGFPNGTPTDSYGRDMAMRVQQSTNKQTFNLGTGSKLVALESKQEMHVRDFFEVNFDIVCASVGYPPEIIMSKYDSNYSASRAAIKDFEHTLDVKRSRFASQFYQVIYNFCLDVWAVSGVIEIPGYLEALLSRNEMVLAAIRKAEWVGDTVPNIDPLKEVQAWRLKMGAGMEHIPLCTSEEAAEALSGLDINSIMEQSAAERQRADELGIEKVELNKETIEDFDDAKEDKPGKPGRKGDDKVQRRKQ